MSASPLIRVGMAGLGMIFEETYRPLFERLIVEPLYRRSFGAVEVAVRALLSRTGQRAGRYIDKLAHMGSPPISYLGAEFSDFANAVDAVCVATPDDRHFGLARAALSAGKHVLIEKPSVLSLDELDELVELAKRNAVLAKVVYHKLFDPDHKKLRTHYQSGVLRHVNNGYCSLLEPKSISRDQFAEWIAGRNPASYVAVHYLKLIDFTFGPDWRLARVQATGQRGQVGPSGGSTWDAVQLRVIYKYADDREAAFDIHTDWVTPDEFPGAVEQEVQFRFDNCVWNAHQRKRGVEVTVESPLPNRPKPTPNHHYSSSFIEPWGEHTQRGYGLEAIERFFAEVATVEFRGPPAERPQRLAAMRGLAYNDLEADRNVVAVVQACEAILAEHAAGRPGAVAEVTDDGLFLRLPGQTEGITLYKGEV